MSADQIDRISSAVTAAIVAGLACLLVAGSNALFGRDPWHVSMATFFLVVLIFQYIPLRETKPGSGSGHDGRVE